MWSSKWLENPFSKRLIGPCADQSDIVGSYSVFIAATVLASLAVMSNTVLVAQTSKEWSQCSGSEGPIVDVIISGCSAVIQAGQDNPKRLATAFNNRGVVYKFKGEYDRALEDYNQAILLNPSYANAYNNRGVIYRLKGDYDRAIRDYDEAVWLDRSIPAFFYNRAIAYTEKQDYDRAIADFEMVLRFNTKNALALYGRGIVRLKKGDSERGSTDIADAKAINPNVAEEFEHSAKR
jgi:tetratricopeptide (TPR) repeat protein